MFDRFEMEQEIEIWKKKLELAKEYNPGFVPRYEAKLRLLQATYKALYSGPVYDEKPPFDGLLTTDDLLDNQDPCILGRYRPHTP